MAAGSPRRPRRLPKAAGAPATEHAATRTGRAGAPAGERAGAGPKDGRPAGRPDAAAPPVLPRAGVLTHAQVRARAGLDPARTREQPRWRYETCDQFIAQDPSGENVAAGLLMEGRGAVVAVMTAALTARTGAPNGLTYRAFHVASQVNALFDNHKALIAGISKALARLPPHVLTDLGVRRDVTAPGLYDSVDRWLELVQKALDARVAVPQSLSLGLGTPLPATYRRPSDGEHPFGVPPSHLDPTGAATEPLVVVGPAWYLQAVAQTGVDPELPRSDTVAVDGTAITTSARLHGDGDVPLDGDVDYDSDTDKPNRGGKARVLGTGTDGRNIHTLDLDARSG